MGTNFTHPQQDLPTYLTMLREHLCSPTSEMEERSKTSKRNTISARQEHAPVIDLNIEAAKGRVSAPRQIGEAQQDFNRRASAARRLENAEQNVPQMVEASMMVETQSTPAGYSHPAFAQEVRGQSTRVDIVSPAELIVLQQSTIEERAGYQHLRNNHLLQKGCSHIADQGVAFYNGRTIDLDKVQMAPQGENIVFPNPDKEDEETGRQS